MHDCYPCFALQVKPRHEKSCAAALSNRGYAPFLPLYRARRQWSDRSKEVELPLFPGYVFCRFDPHTRVPVLTTPGVHSIVGIGKMPVAVAESEIEALEAMVKSELAAEPWPYLESGQRVRVTTGPLCGVDAILLRTNPQKHRLVISVNLLRRSVAVEVDPCWIVPFALGACA